MSSARTLTLQTPLAEAVDPEIAEAATAELGLVTVGDLLRHFPFRYEGGAVEDDGTRRSEPRIGDDIVVIGTVTAITPRSRITAARRCSGCRWSTRSGPTR